ncbi:MAG: Gfo/Idh/MocA family oxidoreductase [Acidobacteria bacterium]|nr:Gfo/Idh/MocA family oxidoreductase [Acidobacteriota bacterium]
MNRPLGVGVVGIGWVAIEHLRAFARNPHVRVSLLCTRNEARARVRLAAAGIDLGGARFTRRYQDLLDADDVDIVSIATPNHLHADQAVHAAGAGKHFLLEKPTGLDVAELRLIRDAVHRAGVRTIVSFELHYNPYLKFVRWLRESGHLGRLLFARVQYLSRVTDWYSGWSWVRTSRSGRSHLLAAGCHAVDALRWCTGLEATEVSAYHIRHTRGYQWPTTIAVNVKLDDPGARGDPCVLGHITSSTDFQMPYTFGVELMGDRATVRDDLLLWSDAPLDRAVLQAACPIPDVALRDHRTPTGAPAIRIETDMPGSSDVTHHPFQGEIDELVECVLTGRETHLSVFDAQLTIEVCIAADRSAARGGRPVKLPLIRP